MISHFPIAQVNGIRKRAECARRLPKQLPEGWSKSSVNPMDLLRVFKSLQIKPGFILRAWQYCAGGNGNAYIWAMPVDAPFPDPSVERRPPEGNVEVPRPTAALEHFLDAIDGDGTPWSYLSASIFAREASEFGALWHGCDWSTHTLLGADPWQSSPAAKQTLFNDGWRSTNPADWTWRGPRPSEWQPSVRQQNDHFVVSFLTYSGLGQDTIRRYDDVFSGPGYQFATHEVTLADGPGGFNF